MPFSSERFLRVANDFSRGVSPSPSAAAAVAVTAVTATAAAVRGGIPTARAVEPSNARLGSVCSREADQTGVVPAPDGGQWKTGTGHGGRAWCHHVCTSSKGTELAYGHGGALFQVSTWMSAPTMLCGTTGALWCWCGCPLLWAADASIPACSWPTHHHCGVAAELQYMSNKSRGKEGEGDGGGERVRVHYSPRSWVPLVHS